MSFVIADLSFLLSDGAFKSSDLSKQLLLSAFARSAHVLFLFLYLSEKFVNAGLELSTSLFSFLVLLDAKLSDVLLMLSFLHFVTILEISFHQRLFLSVLRLKLGYVLTMFLF